MRIRTIRRCCARLAATTAVSVALVASTVLTVPAYGDLASDLANAQAQLESIGAEYAQLQDDLAEAARELEIIKGKIEETENELRDAQGLLAQNAADDYKVGGGQLLDVVLGASSFDDLVSRVYYANRVSDAQAQAIEHVQELKAQLEDAQREQEQEIQATEQKIAEVQQNQADAQALVNSLSAEMRAQLEAEAARNEALASGMQSAADGEASEDADAPVTSTPDTDSGNDSTPAPEPEPAPTPDPEPDTGGSTSNGGSSTVGGSALSYAFTQQGVRYVFGGASPSEGFDCSGIVAWSYAQIGVYLPHSSSLQRQYVQQHGRYTTDISQLQYGDLVFYSGHVAFYVGNGQIYGAWNYGRGIGYGSIYDCGTPLGGGNI